MVTRTLHNVGDPVKTPDGVVKAGLEVTFQLVDAANRQPVTLFDAADEGGELIVGDIITVTTDEAGHFTVELWPNNRGEIATLYKVRLPGGVAGGPAKPFYIRVTEGEGDLTLLAAKAAMEALQPQTLSLFDALLASILEVVGTATAVVTETVNGLMSYVDKVRLNLLWGERIYAGAYLTLQAADDVAAATGKTLRISQVWGTVPATLNAPLVQIVPGGKLDGAGSTAIAGTFEGSAGCIGVGQTVTGLRYAEPEFWSVDGTSDQVEINKAIQSLAAGGVVQGTGRLYVVDGKVEANKDDITLRRLRIKFKDYAVAGNDTSFTGIQASGDRMLIEDCYVDGNRYNQSWGYETAGWGGVFDWSKNSNYGISVSGDDCIVRRNYVTRVTANSMGVPTLGSNNTFEDNTGTDAGKKGFYGGKVSGITIKNNWFYENKHDAGIGLRAASNVVMDGNHCFKNYYGIYVGETYLDFGGYKTTITNNFCYNNGVNNVFIAQYWDAPAGFYEGTNPTPSQAEWDATGLDDNAVKQDTIVSGNHLWHTQASATRANLTAYAVGALVKWSTGTTIWECTTAGTTAASAPSIATGGVAGLAKVIGQSVTDGSVVWIMRGQSNIKYNLEIYNAKTTVIADNILEWGGILMFNAMNTNIHDNKFLARYVDTCSYQIRMSGYASEGSHPNHLLVDGTSIKNNRFELANVTNAIYMDLTTDTEISGNKFKALSGGTYEVRINDATSVANTVINQPAGRIRLNAQTFTAGYSNAQTLGTSTTALRPAAPKTGQMHFDTTLNKAITWNGTVWKDGAGFTA